MESLEATALYPDGNCGCYVLALRIERAAIVDVGALGSIPFEPGIYLYVGRARRHLRQRLERHMRHARRRRWHIDYLLEAAAAREAYIVPTLQECALARELAAAPGARVIPRFGSSDCRCPGHLIRVASVPNLGLVGGGPWTRAASPGANGVLAINSG